MAAKIFFLLALFIPSVIIAQINEKAFSVELKIDKTNFAFGEDVDAIITVKNISGKKDFLEIEELYNIFNCNVTLLYNSEKTSFCLCILTTRERASYKVFQPGEIYEGTLSVRGICGNSYLGRLGSISMLDTGSYSVETYLSRAVHRSMPNQYSVRIKSNAANFHISPAEGIEEEAIEELRNIMDYSLEQFRDSIYMSGIADKLEEFIKRNINTRAADYAFFRSELGSLHNDTHKRKFLELSEFYLAQKPNGTVVNRALYNIYKNAFDRTKNYEEGKLIMKKYAEDYKGTRIETEIKNILELKFSK